MVVMSPQLHVTTNLGGADSMIFNQFVVHSVQLQTVEKCMLLGDTVRRK